MAWEERAGRGYRRSCKRSRNGPRDGIEAVRRHPHTRSHYTRSATIPDDLERGKSDPVTWKLLAVKTPPISLNYRSSTPVLRQNLSCTSTGVNPLSEEPQIITRFLIKINCPRRSNSRPLFVSQLSTDLFDNNRRAMPSTRESEVTTGGAEERGGQERAGEREREGMGGLGAKDDDDDGGATADGSLSYRSLCQGTCDVFQEVSCRPSGRETRHEPPTHRTSSLLLPLSFFPTGESATSECTLRLCRSRVSRRRRRPSSTSER